MSSTTNTELRDFQRTVKAAAESLRTVSYVAGTYVDQFLQTVGLDTFVDDHVVTVRVTVPAADPATAVSAVQEQVSSVYLPSGWAVEVAS